ncbi:hypothetical protein BX592_108216 [Paraburkholderia rhizosphaerae]|uniref:Uncharacterized protein n=1 Tax=Paraburkholderia rhizosphaerae TaxID=480658 RepID=A0A4R8LTE6_9BURK|nr:hypothetical protein BX592_108216 [Paraburkholderia rhizosphaerae]
MTSSFLQTQLNLRASLMDTASSHNRQASPFATVGQAHSQESQAQHASGNEPVEADPVQLSAAGKAMAAAAHVHGDSTSVEVQATEVSTTVSFSPTLMTATYSLATGQLLSLGALGRVDAQQNLTVTELTARISLIEQESKADFPSLDIGNPK